MPAEGLVHQQHVVVIGGSPPHPGVVERLDRDRFVIAADSGLDHARALGLAVDLVVGDFDSVTPDALAAAEAAGVAAANVFRGRNSPTHARHCRQMP